MDHQRLLSIALRVLADEAVRCIEANAADKLLLRESADRGDELLPIRELARRIIARERNALEWGASCDAVEFTGR